MPTIMTEMKLLRMVTSKFSYLMWKRQIILFGGIVSDTLSNVFLWN